jgi:hypothetical protein
MVGRILKPYDQNKKKVVNFVLPLCSQNKKKVDFLILRKERDNTGNQNFSVT